MIRLKPYLPLLVFLLLAIGFAVGLFSRPPGQLPSVLINKPVPDFASAPLSGYEGFSVTALRQEELVILNVWASWCAPCRDEHPLLMDLQSRGVKIYGLNYKDNVASAQRFLRVLGNPYTGIMRDETGAAAIELGVYGMPESFIVANGQLIYKHAGALTAELIAQDIAPLLDGR